MLATASPVLNKIINEWEDDGEEEKAGQEDSQASRERRMCLDPLLEVTVTLSKSYFTDKIEWEGIPPIAAEAVLEYIYKDKYDITTPDQIKASSRWSVVTNSAFQIQ